MINPVTEMRWWHGGIFVLIGLCWKWASKHVKEFRAYLKMNGYTVNVGKQSRRRGDK